MTAPKPREHGIVCSADEVRGLLDGRVSLLVRPMKPQPVVRPLWSSHGAPGGEDGICFAPNTADEYTLAESFVPTWKADIVRRLSPFKPGERRSVRETWAIRADVIGLDGVLVAYRADSDTPRWKHVSRPAMAPWIAGEVGDHRWRSATQMPWWVSRLSVDITEVRIMLLEHLTKDDAIAAGARFTDYGKHESPMSADGGETWGVLRTQKAGWSMVPTTTSDECLGSPQMAFANWWNKSSHGKRFEWRPGVISPWCWAIGVKVTEVRA